MGNNLTNEVKRISDNQFMANVSNLDNILNEASVVPSLYKSFKIEDFIDTNYFYVDSVEDIEADSGSITLDKEAQKISWNIDNFRTGSSAKLTIKAKLKNNVLKEMIPTNKEESITSKLGSISEVVESKLTPVLKEKYDVIYDGNAPSDCKGVVSPEREKHSVFETVGVSSEEPRCEGYQFKGWKYIGSSADRINDDYFIMPEEDVNIKGTWSKLDISKSMDGTVKESLTLYKQVQEDFSNPNKFVRKYIGDTSTFNGNEDVYYYYGEAKNNNVLFANYCWKIVRTTDTGGVKLLYNGVPSKTNTCENMGNDSLLTKEQINSEQNLIGFNNSGSSLTDVGYMYNNSGRYVFHSNTADVRTILSSSKMSSASNYYYADNFNYSDGQYSLIDAIQLSYADNYESLVGKYTFRLTAEGVSKDICYIVSTTNDRIFYLSFSNGLGVESSNAVILTMSSTVSLLDSGNYKLDDPIIYNVSELIDKKFVGNYLCKNGGEVCSSDELMYILKQTSTSMYFVKKSNLLKCGNSFDWDGENYILKDTIDVWNPYEKGILNNYHYTCFNVDGVCKEISYIYRVQDNSYHYINLTNGKSLNNALDEMLYGDIVNSDSSTIKAAIDFWYSNSMKDYTSYLEDTVWCNDRSIGNIGGWDPNGGDNSVNLEFNSYRDSINLSCKNHNDRFTVSLDNGNGALIYPVGLITRQEQSLAFMSKTSPLANGSQYHGLSPMFLFSYFMVSGYAEASGTTGTWYGVDSKFGVRPSISLRPYIEYLSGDGSSEQPYIFEFR